MLYSVLIHFKWIPEAGRKLSIANDKPACVCLFFYERSFIKAFQKCKGKTKNQAKRGKQKRRMTKAQERKM